jgi:hypothetical protein
MGRDKIIMNLVILIFFITEQLRVFKVRLVHPQQQFGVRDHGRLRRVVKALVGAELTQSSTSGQRVC